MLYRPQLALITGATGGFGSAFAHKLASLGCQLVLTGRREERLRELANGLPVPVHTLAFDICDRKALEEAFASLPPEFQAIDLLINNAGLALGQEPAQETSLDDLETVIDVNDKALVRCTRLVLPGMIECGRGHIINISSVSGTYAYPGGHVYCASKAFVTQFSLALRADLVATPIRVTSIEPGMVETEFSLARFKGDEERARKVYANTKPLTADDVADTVVWAATCPPHVNINRIELMPTTQGPGPLTVWRGL